MQHSVYICVTELTFGINICNRVCGRIKCTYFSMYHSSQIVNTSEWPVNESVETEENVFFCNFSCMFLNPNNCFQIWIPIVLIYKIWETFWLFTFWKNCSKGQLISKCPYEKSVSSKIPTKIFLGFLHWKFSTSRLVQNRVYLRLNRT